LSALAGIMTAGSALRLWLHSELERQNKKQNKLVRKTKWNTYPDMGIRGLVPGLPEPPEAPCGGPSVEPLIGLELLRARVDEAPGVLCAIRAIWPRVLIPDVDALASGIDIAAPPANKVRGDRARVRGTADVIGATPGSVDLLSEDPLRALPSARSSSPSTDAEATLDS
jgi:hypothetical protein